MNRLGINESPHPKWTFRVDTADSYVMLEGVNSEELDAGESGPTASKLRDPSVWAAWAGVTVAIVALGTSIFTAQLANKAEDRARDAQEQANEEHRKAQAQWVEYYFDHDAEGKAIRLVVENRSQAAIDKIFVHFKEQMHYLYFDRISACRQERIEPLVANAQSMEGYLEQYDLTTSKTVSVQFVDTQGASWEKGYPSGLRPIGKPAAPEDSINVTNAFRQNHALYIENVPNCQ
ncbi:hypothetical protein [Streptomyces sp. SYSU K21746]